MVHLVRPPISICLCTLFVGREKSLCMEQSFAVPPQSPPSLCLGEGGERRRRRREMMTCREKWAHFGRRGLDTLGNGAWLREPFESPAAEKTATRGRAFVSDRGSVGRSAVWESADRLLKGNGCFSPKWAAPKMGFRQVRSLSLFEFSHHHTYSRLSTLPPLIAGSFPRL